MEEYISNSKIETTAVVAVIPAFNEADRITAVINVLKEMDCINRVVVVDDGSIDRTTEVALSCGVQVLTLKKNSGKAAAMDYGVNHTDEPVILFLDADLVALKVFHVEDLINPVLHNQADMTMGVFRQGRFRTDIAHKISPGLSGQRAMFRWVWDLLESPKSFESMGYGIESELQKLVIKKKVRFQKVYWTGVTQVTKEEKLGAQKGFELRMKMYRDILKSYSRWISKPEI